MYVNRLLAPQEINSDILITYELGTFQTLVDSVRRKFPEGTENYILFLEDGANLIKFEEQETIDSYPQIKNGVNSFSHTFILTKS